MSDQHKCAGKVYRFTTYFPCTKTGRREHGGKWYCNLHHLPTVEAKRAARQEKWQAKRDKQERARVEAELAQDEMKRKAAAYDGLAAERDALLAEVERLKGVNYDLAGQLMVLQATKQLTAAIDAAREVKP